MDILRKTVSDISLKDSKYLLLEDRINMIIDYLSQFSECKDCGSLVRFINLRFGLCKSCINKGGE